MKKINFGSICLISSLIFIVCLIGLLAFSDPFSSEILTSVFMIGIMAGLPIALLSGIIGKVLARKVGVQEPQAVSWGMRLIVFGILIIIAGVLITGYILFIYGPSPGPGP